MNVRTLLTSLVCAGIATLTATSATNVTPITENVTTETEITTEAETATETDNLYPSCGIVTSVTSTRLEWTDFNSNTWVIVGDSEDWLVGDRIAVIMDDNSTDTIYDDIIIKVTYCGWVY